MRVTGRACTFTKTSISDSAEIRVHPTGKAMARFGTKSQGQGHETTYAQIIAEELGIPAEHIEIEEGDTDTAPYGLGTYASRSTPTAGAAAAMAARKLRDKARKIAAYLLEVSAARRMPSRLGRADANQYRMARHMSGSGRCRRHTRQQLGHERTREIEGFYRPVRVG